VCGTVCCGFVGIMGVLFLTEFLVGLWGLRACCVWESFVWVCGTAYLLCVWESFECVFGSECVLCVGQFVEGLWGMIVCCVWECLCGFGE